MRNIKFLTLFALMLMMFLPTVAPSAGAAEVAQGECLVVDNESKSITLISDVDQSQMTFDLAKAKIGLTPEKGDVIRIAYRIENGKNVALKVMNVTKQNLRQE